MKALFKAHFGKIVTLGDQAVVSGANFIISLLLARYLGVEQFGLYALAWMVILGGSSLHQATVVAPLYSLYPKQEDKRSFLKNLCYTNLLYTPLVALSIWVFVTVSFWSKPAWSLPNGALLISLTAFLYITYDFLRREAFVQEKSVIVLIADIIAFGSQPIAILLFSSSLDLMTVFMITASLMAAGIAVLILSQLAHFIDIMVHTRTTTSWHNHMKTILNYAKYLMGTAILQWFSGNFFLIAAGGILGPVAVGAVRIAQNIVGVLHILFQAMENIIPVKAADLLHHQGKSSMYRYFKKMTTGTGLIVLLILTAIAIFREQIISLLYGIEYLPYQGILVGYCILYLLVFIGTMSRFIIRTVEKNGAIFISYLFTTAFSLFFAQDIITAYGVYGIIIGLLSVQVITLSVFSYSLKTSLQWKTK